MKIKKTLALLTAAALLTLTACAEAPEEVKNENSILDNKEQAQSATFEFASLKEIRETSESVLASNNTNVTAKSVRIGSGDAMPAYKISPYNNNFDKLGDIVKYLLGSDFSLDSPQCDYAQKGELRNPDDLEEGTNPHSNVLFMADDMDFAHSIVYHDTGYSFYNGVKGDDPYRYTVDHPTEKRYKVNIGEELDDASYIMTDGSEWSVKDAAAFAKSFCDTYFAPLENYLFDYSLTDLRVKRLDDRFGYVLEFQRVDKNGNLYDNHYPYANTEIQYDPIQRKYNDDNWLTMGMPYLYDSEIQIMFNKKDTVNSFLKGNTPYTGEVTDSGEKLLTLSSAIDIISSKLAGQAAYSFETIELEYYYTALDCGGYDELEEAGKYNNQDMLNFADIQLRPYWAFTMSNCYPDMDKENRTPVNYNCLYLIDALTGEMYIY